MNELTDKFNDNLSDIGDAKNYNGSDLNINQNKTVILMTNLNMNQNKTLMLITQLDFNFYESLQS